MEDNLLEFTSKHCTQDIHTLCRGSWTGLGFLTSCNCPCHTKKDMTPAGFKRPDVNVVVKVPPSTKVKKEGQVGPRFLKQTNHSTNRRASIRTSDTYHNVLRQSSK